MIHGRQLHSFRNAHGARSLGLRRLHVESLEDRRLLTAAPVLIDNAVASNLSSTPDKIIDVNGVAYFTANDGINGTELWRINASGQAEMVEDAIPGGGINPGAGNSDPEYMCNVNGTLYFRATDAGYNDEVWRINASGLAEMVEDAIPGGGINPGSEASNPRRLTNVQGTLYFRAEDGVHGYELWRINASGQAEMVGDLNPGSLDSTPESLTDIGGTLYFEATGTGGRELWRINASGQAEMIEDNIAGSGIRPGTTSAYIRNITGVNGKVYFTANDGSNGYELWTINTSGKAEIVEDSVAGGGINPGGGSSNPNHLTNYNGTLYFAASDGTNGTELWRINATGKAELVEDSVPGGGIRPGSASSTPFELTASNGLLYFVANDGANGSEIWRINLSGQAEMIEDSVAGGGIQPGSALYPPYDLTDANGTLYFYADDGTNGTELWRIIPAGQAEMVEDSVSGGGINPGNAWSTPADLTNVNGTLFFTAFNEASGRELWRINPSGQAELVEDSLPGGGINPAAGSSSPDVLTAVNGVLYFQSTDYANGIELWRVSPTGQAELVDDGVPGGGINSFPGLGINPGRSSSSPGNFILFDGELYFLASNDTDGSELWKLNSSGRAELVEDGVPGAGINSSGSSGIGYLTDVNGTLYFRANGSVGGRELWRLDGTGHAEMIENSVPGGGIHPDDSILVTQDGSYPKYFANINGTLYFSATDGSNGYELWRMNSSGQAEMVEDSVAGGGINPGSASSSPNNLTNFDGTLYFVADNGTSGRELWRINSSGQAEMVEDSVAGGGINPGNASSSPQFLTSTNGVLYFQANDGTNGTELWRVGASGVAEIVEDSVAGGGINPGSSPSTPNNLVTFNGTLYFAAENATGNRELWRINPSGQAEMIDDSVPGEGINPGNASANIARPTVIGGTLYFSATDGTNGIELWRINSSGQAEMVEDGIAGGGIRPGSANSSPRYFTNVNGTLYFSANDGTNGEEIWRINSSGQAEMVEDDVPGGGINPGSGTNNLSKPFVANGVLYFAATDGTHGNELWKINATGQAELVVDLSPGSGNGSPGSFALLENTLYFSGSDGTNGSELWALALTPEINVLGNSVSIADGDTTPTSSDHTDFGQTPEAGGLVSRTFTIQNLDSGLLHLSGNPKVAVSGVNASDFTVTIEPASTVAAMSSTTFTVTFDPSGLGARSATISIFSDDADESTYDFSVQGIGSGPTLRVTSLVSTNSGFVATFNSEIDASALNLYDQGGALGSADVTLVGATAGTVRGSVIVDPGLRKLTFIKSGAALLPDTYTVQLKSSSNAFKDLTGNLLDGNGDNTTGDDYVGNFTIGAPAGNAVTLSAPDFARGYSQGVNLPANTSSGIPITLSSGQGISGLDFQLRYDPALLSITNVTAGASISGASAGFNIPTPGLLVVTISSDREFSAAPGALTVVNLTATVPNNAPYTAKHVLDLTNVHAYDASFDPIEVPTLDDDGIHIAAYFGDANGSQTYNSPDATLAQRIIVGTNTGLSAYQLADPYLIVDVTGNGAVQSNDVTLIQRAIVGTATTQIPPHPGLSSIASGGPDPVVYIPKDLQASEGSTLSVPFELLVTEATGITLGGADLAISYDATRFALNSVEAGQLMVGFGLSLSEATPGLLKLSLSSSTPLSLPYGAGGTLATINFTALAGAGNTSGINLMAEAGLQTALYDAQGNPLTLSPAPTDAADDAVDGLVTILSAERPSTSTQQALTDSAFESEDDFSAILVETSQ